MKLSIQIYIFSLGFELEYDIMLQLKLLVHFENFDYDWIKFYLYSQFLVS